MNIAIVRDIEPPCVGYLMGVQISVEDRQYERILFNYCDRSRHNLNTPAENDKAVEIMRKYRDRRRWGLIMGLIDRF